MQRQVEPELLDTLPSRHPDAICSRRDLERLNALMRHPQCLASILRERFSDGPPERITELGAGDGKFLLRVLTLLPSHVRGTVCLVDRQDAISSDIHSAFTNLGWQVQFVRADILKGLDQVDLPFSDVTVANLFLHHLSEGQLCRLFREAAQRTDLLVALEPLRSAFALACSRWVRLIGCRAVTRHDAPVSVRAGFAGNELGALWPDPDQWSLREASSGLFSHLFVAQRQQPATNRSVMCPP